MKNYFLQKLCDICSGIQIRHDRDLSYLHSIPDFVLTAEVSLSKELCGYHITVKSYGFFAKTPNSAFEPGTLLRFGLALRQGDHIGKVLIESSDFSAETHLVVLDGRRTFEEEIRAIFLGQQIPLPAEIDKIIKSARDLGFSLQR